MGLKQEWLNHYKKYGFKYFVLKIEDFLNSLTEEEILEFSKLLYKHEQYRINLGKKSSNNYYVVNRDDVEHIPTVEDFLKTVGYFPYEVGDFVVIDEDMILKISDISTEFGIKYVKYEYYYDITEGEVFKSDPYNQEFNISYTDSIRPATKDEIIRYYEAKEIYENNCRREK